MTKQLVVVVHGVGVKEAGVSTDLLSTSLELMPEEIVSPQKNLLKTNQNLQPHSSDDFHLCESEQYSINHKRRTFPARIRRYRQYQPDKHEVENERVIADFYWGDIAAIGTGIFGVLMALLKTILGLSHAIRENAREIFPSVSGIDYWMRKVASWAALTIHGPIAAINVVLLTGVLVAWAIQALNEERGGGLWSGTLVAGLAISAGLAMLRPKLPYLTRHFASWLFLTGVLMLIFIVIDLLLQQGIINHNPFLLLDNLLKQESCRFSPNQSSCVSAYIGIYLLGLRLLAVTILCWLAVFIFALCIIAVEGVRSLNQKHKVVSLLAPTLGLMTLLWMLMIACAWAIISYLSPPSIPNNEHIYSGLRGLLPALVGLLAVLAAAGYVWNGKRVLKDLKPELYLQNPGKFADKHRLIVSNSILWMLVFTILIMSLVSFDAVIHAISDESLLPEQTNTFIRDTMSYILVLVASLAILAIGVFRNSFAAGLGILTDVLTYLNDYSWNSSVSPSLASTAQPDPSRTFLERWLGKNKDNNKARGYWQRKRIQDRMVVLVNQLVYHEQPDELVIVSHSQGTVIALDVIEQQGKHWRKTMPANGKLTLITMGSPYTHIHNHYFPSSFPSHHKRPALWHKDRPDQLGNTPGVLDRWVNIFRVDDFVGTHIDSPYHADGSKNENFPWPEERPIPPNGHTMYWVDENVYPILREVMRFSGYQPAEISH